jgi:hypothetical protein
VNPRAACALADRSPAPEGYHFEARPDSGVAGDWRLPDDTQRDKRCRAGAGYHHKACGAPVAALLVRRAVGFRIATRIVPWAYCEDHMYGRWIEDGEIMSWVLVKDTVDGAA